jgi:predicted ATPase
MNAGRQAHSITYAVWVSHYVRGEQNDALETARTMLRQAEQNRSDGHRLTALRALGISQTITGALLPARDTFGKARALAQSVERSNEQRLAVAYRFAADPEIATQFHVALALWAIGETEQGSATARQAVAAARAMGHAHTLGHALAHGAFFAAVCEEADDALALSEETLAFSARHDMGLWEAYGFTLKGYALALRGEAERSAQAMDEGLARLARTQTGAMVPLYRAMHARTLASLGRFDDAEREASAVRHELHFGSERYFWAECTRLLGEYLELCPGANPADIEAAHARALAFAREQKASAWEARASASLGRCYARQR